MDRTPTSLAVDGVWLRAVVRALRIADYSNADMPDLSHCRPPRTPLERSFLEGQIAEHLRRADARRYGREGHRIDPLLTYIRQHALTPMARPDVLARPMRMSVSSLGRHCKEKTGYAVMEYIHRLRVDEAIHRLLTTSEFVKEIAAAVGYPNTAAPDRHFRHRTGMTPSAFRQQRVCATHGTQHSDAC